MGRPTISNAEFERQYAGAVKHGKARLRAEPRAGSAFYDPAARRVVVELLNGCILMCPVDLLQGLRGATNEELADLELMPRGFDLHWRKLDAQFTVAGLLRGAFGTKAWMREMGRAGGKATSAAKRAAARANGLLGGRPRKTMATTEKPKRRREAA